MINNLYALYDKKVRSFGAPFTACNDAVACRSVSGMIKFNKDVLHDNPGDFSLQKLGTYDVTLGLICPCTIVVVAECVSLVTENEA